LGVFLRIYIDGGLGNQLFQLAYAHLNAKPRERSIDIITDPKPRSDRPFDLAPLLQRCEHARNARRGISTGGRAAYQLQRALNKFIPDSLVSLKRITNTTYTELAPFNYVLPKVDDARLQVGYFQHWKYVESVWQSFGVELEQTINEVPLPSEISDFKLSQTCIVHIRRGDLIRSVQTMGILDTNYYEEARSQIKNANSDTKRFIGITDDFEGAKKISDELGIDVLLGPSELSSWQSIALMAKSGSVICANSTFSWWGGILSAQNGGTVVIPNPWFLNWHEQVGDSFMHPKLILGSASFLKTVNFDTDFKE
jgi:hypothetical protein